MMLLALLLALQAGAADSGRAPPTRLYAHLTLATGTLEVAGRDTGTAYHIVATARSAIQTDGKWRGLTYRPSLFFVPYYAAVLRQIASDLEQGRFADTLLPLRKTGADGTTAEARCRQDGCWIIATNAGLPGEWVSHPKLGPAHLRGLARALEAAARRDTTFTPNDADADSLPFVRVLP